MNNVPFQCQCIILSLESSTSSSSTVSRLQFGELQSTVYSNVTTTASRSRSTRPGMKPLDCPLGTTGTSRSSDGKNQVSAADAKGKPNSCCQHSLISLDQPKCVNDIIPVLSPTSIPLEDTTTIACIRLAAPGSTRS